jgi:hypothetical protein
MSSLEKVSPGILPRFFSLGALMRMDEDFPEQIAVA